MMEVFSVVDNNRWGLVLTSRDLKKMFLGEFFIHDISLIMNGGKYRSAVSICSLLFRIPKGSTILVWNLGLTFALGPILRLKGHRVIYIWHEPGNMLSRIRKNGKFALSILQALAANHFSALYNTRIILNEPAIAFVGGKRDVCYAPIPFYPRHLSFDGARRQVIFMGAKLSKRGLGLFSDLAVRFKDKTDIDFVFFPSEEFGKTESDKAELLGKAQSIIWNFFQVDYNQSGVSSDALRYGVPILTTEFERYLVRGPGSRLNAHSNEGVTQIMGRLQSAFDNYQFERDIMRSEAEEKYKKSRAAWKAILGK